MLVLKKKEIVATSLVLLIGIAGYLNWSYQDTVKVTDGESYIETGKKLGEAQFVNAGSEAVTEKAPKATKKTTKKNTLTKTETKKSTAVSDESYFTKVHMEKENSRSKALEILNATASNESFDTQTRQNAQQKILDLASNTEKESVIESIAAAKGYESISVYIDGEKADVIVQKKDFGENDVNILKAIVAEQVNISPSDIKIVEKK